MRTLTCASQGVRNVSFSENFAYVVNGWSFVKLLEFMGIKWFDGKRIIANTVFVTHVSLVFINFS